jgi:hypothetical protein
MGLETAAIIGYASVAASLAGAGISAYSSHQQGKAQERMAHHNAKIAQNAANNEALAASENAKRQRDENRRRLASIRGKMAKSGVNTGAGSAVDVLGTASSELELQALDLFRDSEIRRRNFQSQGAMSLFEGSQAKAAGNINAIGSLISGAGSAADSYVSGYDSGVFRTAS